MRTRALRAADATGDAMMESYERRHRDEGERKRSGDWSKKHTERVEEEERKKGSGGGGGGRRRRPECGNTNSKAGLVRRGDETVELLPTPRWAVFFFFAAALWRALVDGLDHAVADFGGTLLQI